jgi:mannose-1-phosphate guanylyltransferase/mannose-6-phosphate isomerase
MGAAEELGYDYPEENILVEPEAKNTLPAIYAGIYEILKRENSRHDSVVVFPSDHLIEKSNKFAELIKSSEYLVNESLITFGIKPTTPHTGYGYISPGESKGKYGFAVKEFKEKPDYQTAVEYIKKGYYWNSGIFMFNSGIFVEEAKRFAPEIVSAFKDSISLEEAFSQINKKISIDYGIMEKSKNVIVVPADIGWNDLGSFDSFYEVFSCDEKNNIAGKEHMLMNCSNNIVHSEDGKLVVTVGVDDLIIIDNRDALLVCKKDQSQKVKEVVEELKKKKDIRTEYHVRDYRPWGNYQILEEEKNAFKIKRIKINPGKKLSYQLHHYRSEHWIVVRGLAKVTVDDEIKFIRPGESIYMKAGQKHRLENPGKLPLEIIEVQMGEYLEEDDIVRFDDEYGRK